MAYDHELLRERIAELEQAPVEEPERLRELLVGLHALLGAHFRKEEELSLPLLENGPETTRIAEAMAAYERRGGPPSRRRAGNGDEFPEDGTDGEKLRFLVRFALLAPSLRNSQPWRFHVGGDRLELRADRERALPVVDPAGRELLLSSGAALHHLRVALRVFGYAGEVELLPDPGDPDLLARVGLGAEVEPEQRDRRRFWALKTRRTYRARFSREPVPEELLARLEDLAEAEGASPAIVRDPGVREQVAALVAEGDRIQAADARFRAELADWVRAGREHAEDGLPATSIGIPGRLSALAPFVVRAFDWGRRAARRDRRSALAAPVLAALVSRSDEPADLLAAGQALSAVLIAAEDQDVSASFLNQPIEVAELRPRLAGLLRLQGSPQLLLRFGHARTVLAATPRRGADEVTD